MNNSKIKEKVFLNGIKNNDRQAFINAYDLYVDQLYRFIYFKVGNKEEAEDLLSAVFLKTWSYLQNNFTNHQTLKSLFYKIARNLIIDHYRKTNQWNRVDFNNYDLMEYADEKQNISKQIEIASDLVVIETKLPLLKDEYREVIILRYINELSIKEIADILDKSKGNIRILIYRAVNALKELVKN